jgi:DNA-binding CsgD family transcriptional regulator
MQETSTSQPQGAQPALDAAFQNLIHGLWDDLAAYEAGKSDMAVQHLLATVAGLVDAQNAYWTGVVRPADDDRDPLLGWVPRAVRYLRPFPHDDAVARGRLRPRCPRGGIDEPTLAHVRLAGSYRARRLRDMVSPEWFDSDTYAGYVGQGVHDLLVVGVPVSKTAEAYYGFLRMRKDDPFTEAQRDTALYAMRGLTWFHRKVLLAEGLLATRAPLSPMERRVLALLLTEHSEKVIAANLEVAPATLHTYVRDVFRKFDVSGRNGLTALWLGRQA